MECKICNCKCIIPTSSYAASSQNILIEDSDGTNICSGCFDAKEFAADILNSRTKISTSSNVYNPNNPKEKNTNKKVENKVYYNCLKCKNTYTGPVCICGFNNPLYRRK